MKNTSTNKTISVLVVDDHPFYRSGLIKVLKNLSFIKTCYEADNGLKALELLEVQPVNIVMMDLAMPVMDGKTAVVEIKKKHPGIGIVIISMQSSKKDIVEMLELGVNGYLLKETDSAELNKALQLILDGNHYYTPKVYHEWAEYLINKAERQLPYHKQPTLSDREIEIIKLFCNQMTAKQIAERIYVSEATVNNHRSHIMKKAGVDNIVGLVIYAIKNGIFIP